MENKIELEVEFWQKVKYSGTVEVTHEEAELLRLEDWGDIEQYKRENGRYISNPLWDILSHLAIDSNAVDRDDELETFVIKEQP